MALKDKVTALAKASGVGTAGMPVAPSDTVYTAKGDQWVAAIDASSANVYSWSDDITATDPGIQKVKINNSNESLATNIYISELTLSGGSVQAIGESIVIGDLLRIQQFGATGNYITAEVDAAPIDNGGWWTVPVIVLENGGGFVEPAEISLEYWPTGERGATEVQINNTNGYELSSDSSTSSTGFLTAMNGVQLQITNNGLGSNYSNLPDGVTEFVTHPDGNALMDQVDGIYSLSIEFMARPTVRDKYYLIEFIALNGGSPVHVFSRQGRFAKQIIDESVSVSFTTPCLANLLNLPISVFITTEETDAKIWAQKVAVTKNNAPIV